MSEFWIFSQSRGDMVAYNLQSSRHLEEAVESLFNFMGYSTIKGTVLHTRSTPIRAEMRHPKEGHRLLIECKHHHQHQTVGIAEVQTFCSRVAFARENTHADCGMLISNTDFTPEAIVWCAKNCSFVKLRTYKQLMTTSTNFRKLLRKFHT
jgi:hypothetical protein